jgi:hypothetical protein
MGGAHVGSTDQILADRSINRHFVPHPYGNMARCHKFIDGSRLDGSKREAHITAVWSENGTLEHRSVPLPGEETGSLGPD